MPLSKAHFPLIIKAVENLRKVLQQCPLSNRQPMSDSKDALLKVLMPSGVRQGSWPDIDEGDLDRPARIKLRELCGALTNPFYLQSVNDEAGVRDEMLAFLDETLQMLRGQPKGQIGRRPKYKVDARVFARKSLSRNPAQTYLDLLDSCEQKFGIGSVPPRGKQPDPAKNFRTWLARNPRTN